MKRFLLVLGFTILLSSPSFADKIAKLVTDPKNPKHPVCTPGGGGGVHIYNKAVPDDNSCTFSSDIVFTLSSCLFGGTFSDSLGDVGYQEAVGNEHYSPKYCCCWGVYGGAMQVRVNDSCASATEPPDWVTSSDCDNP